MPITESTGEALIRNFESTNILHAVRVLYQDPVIII